MRRRIPIGISPQVPSWSTSPAGRSLVLAGQKSGGVWALDPDNKGKVVWYSDVSRGQILFGGAADEEQAYFGLRGGYGGLVAIRLKDGLERWFADLPPHESMAQHPGISAAVSVIPGVVFSAGLDGTLRAFSSFDGRPIWQYNTAKDFETVNGVKARGGSIGSAGATIVNGMVYVTSGIHRFPEWSSRKRVARLQPVRNPVVSAFRRTDVVSGWAGHDVPEDERSLPWSKRAA